MKVRTIASVLPFVLALAAPPPLAGQHAAGHRWTDARPDAHGPIGISEGRTLKGGEIQLSVRYLNERLGGAGVGTDSLSVPQLLSLYDVAPTKMVTQGAQVELLVGLTRHLTLAASGSFVQKTMDHLAPAQGNPNLYLFYQTESLGPEDVKVSALYNIFDQGAVRAHLHAGVSIPVGLIDFDAATLLSEPFEAQLPYRQQLGSGTFDVLPGFLLAAQNEKGTLGIQGKGVVRIGENDRDWALGNVFTGTVWGSYRATDEIAVTLGARFTSWGNVRGFDAELDPSESPANATLAQGGSRVDLPLGLVFVLPEGRFAGHQLGLELLYPVHQDLDGPQLRHEWTVTAGWRKAVSF